MVTTDLLMSGATTKQVSTYCCFLPSPFREKNTAVFFFLLQAKFFINVLAEPAEVVNHWFPTLKCNLYCWSGVPRYPSYYYYYYYLILSTAAAAAAKGVSIPCSQHQIYSKQWIPEAYLHPFPHWGQSLHTDILGNPWT